MEETNRVGRKIFATVTQTEFAAFLDKAKSEGFINERSMSDINGALRHLINAYSEGRVVILSPHDISEAKKVAAKEKREKTNFYHLDGEPMRKEDPNGE
jgi:hypothetical protein